MIPPPPSARAFGRIGAAPGARRSGIIPAPPARAFAGGSNGNADLESLVDQAGLLVTQMLGSGYAVGFDVLGDIRLPPGSETQVDRAQLRALAALYLAAALEPARIIASAETLAALAASGSLQLDLGDAAGLIRDFWRGRFERIAAGERQAFFGRLFGPSYGDAPANSHANDEFESLMLELCEALYRIDDDVQVGIRHQARIRNAARNLIANLVYAGGGATPFLAEEILRALKLAIALLSNRHLQSVFGSRDIWGLIEAIGRMSRIRTGSHRSLVSRAQSGMQVIAWLGDAAPHIDNYSAPLLGADHPVVPAALDWLQASLTMSENPEQFVPKPSTAPTDGQASPWADIGF